MNSLYAVIITTHDRILDAKISMELIRFLWPKNPKLRQIDIYHCYNGEKHWYPQKNLENSIVRRQPLDHYHGAADLIDVGVKRVLSSGKNYRYIIVQSADVLLIKPAKIAQILQIMDKKGYQLATSLWPSFSFIPQYFCSEFFVITPQFAKKIFPLDFPDFFKKRMVDRFLHRLTKYVPILTVPKVELCFTVKVMNALHTKFWNFNWGGTILLIPDRKVVWVSNRFFTDRLGYYSYHNIHKKADMILQNKDVKNILNKTSILKSFISVKT